MIKVLHVVGTIPRGGIGSVLKEIVGLMDNSKFSNDFIYSYLPFESDFKLFVESKGAKVYEMPSFKKMGIFKYVYALKKFYKLNSKNYDILHVHSINTGILDLFFAFYYGISVRIVHSHSTKFSDSKARSFRNWLIFQVEKILITSRVACSKESGNFLFNKKEFLLFRNAINTSRFQFSLQKRLFLRSQLDFGDDFLVLGHVGNFDKVKNHIFILEVFSQLRLKNRNTFLCFFGDGVLFEEIKRSVISRGLENNVCFMGRKDNINDYLSALDVMIFPSLFEGIPLSLIEAQACGLPVVSSKNISKEVICSDRFSMLSLTEDLGHWVDQIIVFSKLSVTRRSLYKEIVSEKGFSSELNIKVLEDYYCKELWGN